MFDISFGELAVIGTVALVVIGPEKLPKVARTAGMLFGRVQRMASGFRADLERELRESEFAQLQKQMSEDAANFRDEMAESAASAATALSGEENRILPPADIVSAEVVPPVKPRRTRKQAAAESTSPILAPESGAESVIPVKKPRKRKVVEPQTDLFAAPPPANIPDAGDRR